MKKLLIITGICASLLLVVYIGLNFFLGSVVKAGVNRFGPRITQTKVELASAEISPFSGTGTLSGLAVANPTGWSAGNAFYLGKIHLSVEPRSLLSDHVVIHEIVIEQPEFLYETKIVASNVGDLMKNIQASVGGGKTSQPEAKEDAGKKIEVRHFLMKGGVVTVGFGTNAVKVDLPPIEINDIGTKEGGVTPNEFAFAVMRSVTPQIIAAASAKAAAELAKDGGASAIDSAKKAGEAIKGIFGGKK